MCGSDGRTYHSECHLKVQQRSLIGLTVARKGECIPKQRVTQQDKGVDKQDTHQQLQNVTSQQKQKQGKGEQLFTDPQQRTIKQQHHTSKQMQYPVPDRKYHTVQQQQHTEQQKYTFKDKKEIEAKYALYYDWQEHGLNKSTATLRVVPGHDSVASRGVL